MNHLRDEVEKIGKDGAGMKIDFETNRRLLDSLNTYTGEQLRRNAFVSFVSGLVVGVSVAAVIITIILHFGR